MAQYTTYTAKGGKRKTLYGKTCQEVASKLAKALSDREGGLSFDAESLKLGAYLYRWLEDSVKGTVRSTTYERVTNRFPGRTSSPCWAVSSSRACPRHMYAASTRISFHP
jgi:hypothetical protein